MTDRDPATYELISAYLDGEVSSDERARAEQLLDADSELRASIDELRTIGDGLRELPKYQLRADFVGQAVAGHTGTVQPAGPSKSALRRLITVAAAVAAAVLMMFAASQWLPDGDDRLDPLQPIAAQPQPDEDEPQFVDQPAMMLPNKFVFVVDVWLTQQAVSDKTFENALMRHGIAFDSSIKVDPVLEKALLESRFLNPPDQGNKKDQPKKLLKDDRLQLVYMVASSRKLDRLVPDLKNQPPNQVVKVLMDMTTKPDDLRIFDHLRRAAHLAADDAGDGRPAERALRLEWPASAPAEPVGGILGWTGLSLVTWLAGDSTPLFIAQADPPQPAALPPANPWPGNADFPVEVLFVLRVAP